MAEDSKDNKELREVIREILHQGAINLSEEQVINKDGHEVRVIPLGDGCTRFDLPRLEKSYVMMSGRLYDRPYLGDTQKSDSKSAATDESKSDTSQTHFASQPSYTGGDEKVDTRIFKNKIICKCGNPRWVKNSDMFQVKKCKPCTLKGRQDRRKK